MFQIILFTSSGDPKKIQSKCLAQSLYTDIDRTTRVRYVLCVFKVNQFIN